MTPKDLFQSTLGFAPDGFHTVVSVNTDTLLYTVYRNEATLLVSFGPTRGDLYWEAGETIPTFLADAKDWLRNFDTKKIGGVHRGFKREWEEIRPAIQKEVKTYQPTRIILAGFSQGSAHATLALSDLIAPELESIEAHGFGTPRVFGWGASAEYDNWLTITKKASLTRYNHRRDPIQHTPFVLQGFAHVGHRVDFGGNGIWDMAKYHDPSAYIGGLE